MINRRFDVRRVLSFVLLTALVLGLAPAAATVASARQTAELSAPLRSEDQIDATVSRMLSAGAFVEGEAWLMVALACAGAASVAHGLRTRR